MKVVKIVLLVFILYFVANSVFKNVGICPRWIDLMPRIVPPDYEEKPKGFSDYFCLIFYPVTGKVY